METLIFGEIVSGAKYRERLAVYGLAYNHLGQIAVIRTPRGDFLPGGGIEDLENHKECLMREFLEETGYQVKVGDYIGCGILYEFSPRIKEYIKGIGHFYEVSLVGHVKEKVDEDHELIWLEPEIAHAAMVLEHQAWTVSQRYNETLTKRLYD